TTEVRTGDFAGQRGQRYALFPGWDGGNNDRAGCGISVGTNGVSLFEHTNSVIPCVLVHATPIKGWTHLTVVYANGQPTLYLNGAAVKTGVPSPYPVFPSTTQLSRKIKRWYLVHICYSIHYSLPR